MKKRMHTFSSGEYFFYFTVLKFSSSSQRAKTPLITGTYKRVYSDDGEIIICGKICPDDTAYMENMLDELCGKKISVNIDGRNHTDMVILESTLDSDGKNLLGNLEIRLGHTNE